MQIIMFDIVIKYYFRNKEINQIILFKKKLKYIILRTQYQLLWLASININEFQRIFELYKKLFKVSLFQLLIIECNKRISF